MLPSCALFIACTATFVAVLPSSTFTPCSTERVFNCTRLTAAAPEMPSPNSGGGSELLPDELPPEELSLEPPLDELIEVALPTIVCRVWSPSDIDCNLLLA